MASGKIKKPEALDLKGGSLNWEYIASPDILTVFYKIGTNEFAIHFEPTALAFYKNGTLIWRK